MSMTILETLPDATLVTDRQGNILKVSPCVAEQFACPSAETILGSNLFERVAPEYRVKARAVFDETLEDGAFRRMEARFLRFDGSGFIGELHAGSAKDGPERARTLTVSIRDITEQVLSAARLRESEERFRALFEGSLDAIFIADPETGRILDANPAASELLGLPLEEVVGRRQWEIYDPARQEEEQRLFREYVLDRRPGALAEKVVVRPAGSRVHAEMLAQIVQLDGIPVLHSTFRDITERRLLEADLARVQRLESLGVLAGGIAHDFNNILTAISTNLSMIRMFGNPDEETGKMLADAETAADRAKNLTQQLLTFARGGVPVKRPVCLSRLLVETAEFALSGSNVVCRYDIPEDLPAVEADEGQLSQVIQNLVINADQAMPDGGVIRIRAEAVNGCREESALLGHGTFVRVSISDHGTGIPEKYLSRIFDPFFTTKQKGSGLGLSTTFSIVHNHGGHIRVDSVVGDGTTFTVILPATEEPAEPDAPRWVSGGEERGRVLVIDDDEMVRRSACETLRRLGYAVASAPDGAAGLDAYVRAREQGDPFHAVIMDVTIPGGMGGREAIARLLKIDPEARVVVSSGYANDPVMAHYREHGFLGVIRKPYKAEELGDVVETVTRAGQEGRTQGEECRPSRFNGPGGPAPRRR